MKTTLLLIPWMLAISCRGEPPRPDGPGRSAVEVHRDGADAPAVRFVDIPGSPERTTVVHRPPEVWALWVPDHLDRERNMMIGGHFVYVVLRPGEMRDPQGVGTWFIEDLDRELEPDRMIEPESRGALAPFLAHDADGRWINEGAVQP